MGGLWRLCCKGEVEDHASGNRRKHCIADRSPYGRAWIKASWLVGTGSKIKGLGIMGRHSVLLVELYPRDASHASITDRRKKTRKRQMSDPGRG